MAERASSDPEQEHVAGGSGGLQPSLSLGARVREEILTGRAGVWCPPCGYGRVEGAW